MDLFVVDTFGSTETPKNIIKYENDQIKPMDMDTDVDMNSDFDNLRNSSGNKFNCIFNNLRSLDGNGQNDRSSDEEDNYDFGEIGPPTANSFNIVSQCLERENELNKKVSKPDSITNFMNSMGWMNTESKGEKVQYKGTEFLNEHVFDINKELKEIKKTELERLQSTPGQSIKQINKMKKMERSKTKGAGWFNLPATEVSDEIQNDLKILQMRSALDPKHFYKKNDLKVLPKYFQIGTVQHSPLDYYSERHIRQNKKKTIVDELMADADFKQFTKRKYNEINDKNQNYNHKKSKKKD